MKRKVSIAILLIISLIFCGCGNSIVDKSIEQAKKSIESKEYDKALASLELALDEDKDNEEANKLYSIIDGYKRAKNLVDENKMAQAKETIDKIDEDYINYSIKDDVDSLKEQVDNYLKEVENITTVLSECENMFNNKQYAECKNNINDKVLSSQYVTDEQKQKSEELLKKSDEAINEIEAQRAAEEKKKQEEAKKAEEEKQKQQAKNGYSKDEVNSILKSLNKGGICYEGWPDEYVNGELCYVGNIVWNKGNRTRMFLVGSKTLTIYNSMGEAKGSIYENQNFDTEF